jgi:putative chitinase
MTFNALAVQKKLAEADFYHTKPDGAFGRRSFAALFSYMAKRELGDFGLALGEGCAAHFPLAGLNSGLRIAHFLAQTATETGAFKSLEENLNYTAKAMMRVWPTRFPDEASTAGLVMNPKALALKVYSGRLGNGAPATGDGWTFRGRGLIQLTGRTNYAQREAETNIPLVIRPELASDPKTSIQIACLYWTSRKINAACDADDLSKVRKLVNGGQHGIADAATYLKRARLVLL